MAYDNNGKELPKGIRQKVDGRYEGRFRYAGQDYYVVGKSSSECKKMLNDLRYEVEHGIYAKQQNITVNDWFQTWLDQYKRPSVKKGTITVYQEHFNCYIKNEFGKRKLKDIRPEHIQKLYNDMQRKGYSNNTIELTSVVLSGMYKQAIKNKVIKENPVPLTTLPRNVIHKEHRVMTVEEQAIFLEYVKKSYLADICELALSTGMRSGELRGLRWQDIDLKNKIIHVNNSLNFNNNEYYLDTPKTITSKRDIPMLDNVYNLLKNRKKKQAEQRMNLGELWMSKEGLEDLVFTSELGYPMNRDRFRLDLNAVIYSINSDGIVFEHITPHTFRHTFATRCIENGMQPQVLKAILGHSKLAMTMDLYSHVLPNIKANEMQKIAGLFWIL
ncbi:integrase [Anaerotaenia torta]|uniref:tyrosine-type recombinase/integrase n=1 Tax=Anaerotaenia torta TaxID=433293 RepID=UPI003D1F060C